MNRKYIFLAITIMSLFFISCEKKAVDPKARKLNNKAIELMMDKNYDEALVILDQALLIQKKYLIAYGNKLTIYLEVKDFNNALLVAEAIQEIFPESAYGYFYKGMLLEKLGNIERSNETYKELVDLYKEIDFSNADFTVIESYCIALKLANMTEKLDQFTFMIIQNMLIDEADIDYISNIKNNPRMEYFDSRLR